MATEVGVNACRKLLENEGRNELTYAILDEISGYTPTVDRSAELCRLYLTCDDAERDLINHLMDILANKTFDAIALKEANGAAIK